MTLATISSAGALKEATGFGVAGYGTALPSSPTDGMEFVLVDSVSAPTYQWRMLYNVNIAGASKWMFLGGAPQRAIQATSGTFTSNAAYIDPSNVCSLTAVRTGVYDIYFGGSFNNNTSLQLMNLAPKVGAGTPVDAESAYSFSPTAGSIGVTATRTLFSKAVTAADLIKLQVKPTGNGNVNFQWLAITPVLLS
jgi:hypothetical protein